MGDTETYFMAKVGNLTTSQEIEINILKGCTLLTHLNGAAVTIANLLRAIEALNARCEQRLGRMTMAKMVTAKDPAGFATPYCDHYRLSLARPGQTFRALVLEHDQVGVCSAADVDEILAAAAAFTRVEDYKPEGQAHKQAHRLLVQKAEDVRVQLSKL